jgi:hypothetical protein
MIRACSASFAGDALWLSMRNPTVSMPRRRASPKCWIDTSASVQWVAIRATEAPSCAFLRWCTVPRPGSMRMAILAWRASSTAALMSWNSSTLEKP